MDAARLMISDHHELEMLFGGPDEGASADGDAPARDPALVSDQLARLRAHVTIADELLYPAVRERAPIADLARVKQADEDLHRINDLLDRLASLEPRTSEFDEALDRLREWYTRHTLLEESVILPRAEDLLSDEELLRLGERMQKRRDRLTRRPLSTVAAAVPLTSDPSKTLRTVAIIVLAGVALAVLGRLRRPMRTSGPRPLRR